jgi:phosphonate ABC transporter permease subunit PhnE
VNKRPSLLRSFIFWIFVLIGLITIAYGFQVTKVNFIETRSEQRLTQLTRIIRALAHPDILEYDKEEVFVEAPVYLPCPEAEVPIHEPDTSGPYIILDPNCEDAGEFIVVEGFNFLPNVQGPINFIPPSGASLNIGNFTADSNGEFEQRVQLPKRQPVEEAQTMRVISRKNVGLPHFSSVAHATWEKIIETVFLALLATIFGTLMAIPLSFLAARNLMSEVKSPVSSVALMLIGWPIGIFLGLYLTQLVGQVRDILISNMVWEIAGLIISPILGWLLLRWAVPAEETNEAGLPIRIGRIVAILVAVALIILSLLILGKLMYITGAWLEEKLGAFSFLGYFVSQAGEVLRMVTPVFTALAGGAVSGGILSKFGLIIADRYSKSTIRVTNAILAAIAGAIIFALIGAGIDWLYQLNDPIKTLFIPAVVGVIVGLLISLRLGPKELVPIGIAIYLIMRTILNAARSIEPLIYVIVFVVWVGIGPFAGALALALHTIAALAKLYSEQVESILPGPLEAVTATGANRLQTIVYAVVPQIIPPYISFTMYRWDINVRMSTIIGFAGGGGIGFLLQQNIRLLDYRAAAVQMLAIAFVVASMDYTSAWIREKFV